MDIDQLIARLNEFDALREADQIKRGSLDRIEPGYAEAWPDRIHSAIVSALEELGIPRPYQHQAEAIEQALEGIDVVMESPTASGKTLAFAVPMLDALVRDRNAHALLLYPTKALALDQRGAMHELCAKLSGTRKIESWPYDGNVPEEHRNAIRQAPPAMLMTNPEYLNMSFLAHREQWEKNGFLPNLKYIVIDEMHEYRGFFGGNMALLLRRFLLHLKHLGVEPRIFMATATCANPEEHAEELTGRPMHLVSAHNSLRPKREFMFINPDIPDFGDIFRLRIQNAAIACLKEDVQTLIFCPSKKFIEEVYSRCRAACEEHGLNADLLTVFHADMKAERKEDIQQRIKAGTIRVIFSTNALELGMDIGGMDGVILAGFPTNIMSAWQQMGRAGRGWDREAFVLFYAMKDPIDRFFVGNLDAFLNKPYDRLVVDPDNEELIKNHLPSLIEENPNGLSLADRDVIGSAFYQKAVEEQAESIPGFKPQPYLRMRGDLGQVYTLKHGSQEIGQISDFRRFREAYLGAIFPFLGSRYRVRALTEENAIELAEAEPYLRTDPGFFTFEKINEHYAGKRFGNVVSVYYGKLDILTSFTGFSLVDERSNEKKEVEQRTDMLREANRHALWITVLEQDELARNGLSALEHLLRVGAMFVIPADRFDASTLSRASGAGDYPTAFYYETYAGGIGVAKNLFAEWESALREGIKVANNCPCNLGCPDCIEPPKAYGDTKINKHLGIELAERILDAARMGPSHELREGVMVPVQQGHQTVTVAPQATPAPPSDQPVEALIAQGESEAVEFKSTLRINLHTGEKDRRMEDAVIKTLAGFLNADGGTLLIGIADDGTVAGIDADEFKDEDAMSLHLTNLVKGRMNDVSLMSHVKVTFEDCDGKRVLRVVCSPSTSPAYVTEGADEVFYLRAGSATEKLTGRRMMEYVNFRFSS